MFRILHLFIKYIKLILRTILNEIPDNFQYICILSKHYMDIKQDGITFIENDINEELKKKNIDNILKNEKKIFIYFENITFVYKIINLISPNAIITTINPYKKSINLLLNNIDKNQNYDNKIYYIQHGLFNNASYDRISRLWSEKIKYIVCDKHCYEIVKNKITKNIFKINGLPQFDRFIGKKKTIEFNREKIYEKLKIPKNKKIIFIIGSSYNYKEKTNDIILNIISILDNILNDYYILIKDKTKINYQNLEKKIKKNSLIILNNNELIYDYLTANIIIVIEGGTSYIESLLMNPKVILYQKYNKSSFFDIDNDELFIAKNDEKMKEMIKFLDTNNVSDKYLDCIEQYLHSIIGENIDFVSEKICNLIYNDSKNLICS